MSTPPYPLSYVPVKKSWLDRNAGWKIPLGCLMVIVLLGGFVAVVFTVVEMSFRKSVVYQKALNRADRNSKGCESNRGAFTAGQGSTRSTQRLRFEWVSSYDNSRYWRARKGDDIPRR
jgi:hypothetical protein